MAILLYNYLSIYTYCLWEAIGPKIEPAHIKLLGVLLLAFFFSVANIIICECVGISMRNSNWTNKILCRRNLSTRWPNRIHTQTDMFGLHKHSTEPMRCAFVYYSWCLFVCAMDISAIICVLASVSFVIFRISRYCSCCCIRNAMERGHTMRSICSLVCMPFPQSKYTNKWRWGTNTWTQWLIWLWRMMGSVVCAWARAMRWIEGIFLFYFLFFSSVRANVPDGNVAYFTKKTYENVDVRCLQFVKLAAIVDYDDDDG